MEGWHILLYADGRLFVKEFLHPVAFYDALLGSGVTVGEPWEPILAAHEVDKVLYVAQPEQIPALETIKEQVRADVLLEQKEKKSEKSYFYGKNIFKES